MNNIIELDLDDELLEYLDMISNKCGMSIEDYIIRLIEEDLRFEEGI